MKRDNDTVLARLDAMPQGTNIDGLAELMGVKRGRAQDVAMQLRREGRIHLAGRGSFTRWHTAANAATVAAWLAEMRSEAAARKRRLNTQRASRQRREEAQADWPVVQRIVPALHAVPLRVRAPVSVFAWAGGSMNRLQRESNRRNAHRLESIVRSAELMRHVCENCGQNGAHWVSTRGTSLAGIIAGVDDQEGFWTCPKLYGPDGRRLAA